MPLLLGLDIGTTSTIGVVIDDQGRSLAVESRPATLYSDHPNWSEEDPAEWWRNVGEICRALLSRPGIAAADIVGVGVTGMLKYLVSAESTDGPRKLTNRRTETVMSGRRRARLRTYPSTSSMSLA